VTAVDHGADLVNLTACETELGEITTDGVVGLRQAFLRAGCRALTMSMWSIPTDETVEQIGDFYSHWLANSRGPQSRRTKRCAPPLARVRDSPNSGYSGHPIFWMGIFYVGDPGDLPGVPADNGEPTNNAL
jgi:CHAT domain-containing protein